MKLDTLIEQVSQLAKRNREQTREEKPIRIMVGLGVQAVTKVLQIDLERYFQDPDYCLKYLLRQKLFYHEHFPDVDKNLMESTVTTFFRLREIDAIEKRPATRELINWIRALKNDPDLHTDSLRKGDIPFLGILFKKSGDYHKAADVIQRGRL